jgi:hypothetical protein
VLSLEKASGKPCVAPERLNQMLNVYILSLRHGPEFSHLVPSSPLNLYLTNYLKDYLETGYFYYHCLEMEIDSYSFRNHPQTFPWYGVIFLFQTNTTYYLLYRNPGIHIYRAIFDMTMTHKTSEISDRVMGIRVIKWTLRNW